VSEIRFFHNAPDKLAAACRITAMAWRRGRKVTVFAPEPGVAQRFDSMLWTFQPLAFVPHVAADSPLAAETPVLVARRLDAPMQDDVLVNLSHDVPAGFEHFAQVIEIVTQDADDRVAARGRWGAYKQAGHPIETNDLSRRETA